MGDTPVPVPRPRQRGNNTPSATTDQSTSSPQSQDVPDSSDTSNIPSIYPKLDVESIPSLHRKQDYENFNIIYPSVQPGATTPKVQNSDGQDVNANPRPVPAPRRAKIVVHDGDGQYQNVTPAAKPTGAIKRTPAQDAPASSSSSPHSSSGITTVHNDLRGNLNSPATPGTSSTRFSFEGEKLPGVDRSESDGASIGSGDSGRKYKTTSPGELFKSIGITSKLLTESISERVSHKTKKVAKNLKSSSNSIASWKTEATSKLKNVSKSINNMAEDKLSLSLTRNKTGKSKRSNSTGDDGDFLERRQTVPENSDLMKNIQFNSPLNNQLNKREDLTKGSASSSTYDIPKNAKRTNFEEPPSYDSAQKSHSNSSASLASASSTSTNPPSTGLFARNTGLSQSLYSKVIPKKNRNGGADTPSPKPLRLKNKSESNLHESKFYIDSVREDEACSSSEDVPPPAFPAPVLDKKENPYGKLNVIRKPLTSSSSEEDNTLPELLTRIEIRNKQGGSPDSRRATCNSVNRIFSRRSSSIEELRNNLNLRSESWNFYDISQQGEDEDSSRASTPEPTYVNDGHLYGQICEMETSLLKPEPLSNRPVRHDYDEVSISDIIDEFDPLAQRRSLVALMQKTGANTELNLIENILGAESYGRHVKLESSDENLVPEDTPSELPKPPKRTDSLLESKQENLGPPLKDPPAIPRRKKSRSPKRSMIIHQNLNLPSDSMENLVDETAIEPFLAIVDEPASNPAEPIDLSYPSSSQGPQTIWFDAERATAAEPEKFIKNSKVDPVNEKTPDSKAVEKIQKELPSELARINEDEPHLPTYQEAVGSDTLQDPLPGPSSTKSRVTSKLFNALKRKSSFKAKSEVRTVLEMVPKPLLTERFISHQGPLIKFPSGMIGDVFHELTPRSVVLSEKIIQTFQDTQKTQPKETLYLKYILSLQCVVQHKFNNEGGLDLHCFEIVLALPKKDAQQTANPNLIITSTNSGNAKTQRQSYIFGVHKRSDRNVWMAKILQSVTDVFPVKTLAEFTRGGWCYMKKSVSSSWNGAWILLAKRKLYFYNYQDRQLEQIDLRKARCIGGIESDESIRNLHIESGPTLFIDCPPYATLYFIMSSPRETQIWRKITKDMAHQNGNSLHSQQLTRNDVPVLIDKCINFIYAHGSMSEGIYRKSGSASQIQKVLQLFKEDAFAVQLTRTEYNEYDVAGALKKFIRDIPNSFLGQYAISFVSVASLKSVKDKIDAYKELLSRLPKIEHQTLKKLIGHLNFIASLEKHNKMGVPNLAMIWGSTLMANSSRNMEAEQYTYSQDEADVVADLLKLYKNLFTITPEEYKKELLMLNVLQKYHAAAENLSDAVKQSGDLKVWITIDCGEGGDSQVSGGAESLEEKPQVNVTVTPTKTASDVLKELAGKTGVPWYKMTLYELIGGGSLKRPIHYSEKVLDIVLRWSYWSDADRKSNYLAIRRTTTLNDVFRHIQMSPVLTPSTELKFASRSTKTLRTYKLELIGREIVVLKLNKKDKVSYEEVMKINLAKVHAYLGQEAKRDQTNQRWTITLVDHDFKTRSGDSPFMGHILGGNTISDQTVWYSSIMYSLYKDNILPSSDLFF